MFLTNPFPGAFGIDIGDLSIKLVQLVQHTTFARQPFFTIKEVRGLALPPGLIVNGEIQEPEAVRKKILQIVGKEGRHKKIISPWVVASLPEPKTFLKLITIETPAAGLAYDEVAYHAKKHLPFEMEETYLDWQCIASDENSTRSQVLIGAVQKVIADAYTYLIEAAGLNPLALEIEALSIVRAMITHKKDYRGMARAILDLGATRSSLIIYDHNSIQFSTNIAFSGELLTMAIAQGLKMEYEMAEKLKLTAGLKHHKQHPKYIKIVADVVDNLSNEIERAMTFYKEHFNQTDPITHITLCGGAAQLRNLDMVLSHKLRIAARPGNAWKNIVAKEVTDQEKVGGLSYAAAIGLAIRAAINPLHA